MSLTYKPTMPRKQYIPIQPSPLEHENTGVFTSAGRQFKVVGFNITLNMAELKNDRGEYAYRTNRQIEAMRKIPAPVAQKTPIAPPETNTVNTNQNKPGQSNNPVTIVPVGTIPPVITPAMPTNTEDTE
jgi:hypothetical protein